MLTEVASPSRPSMPVHASHPRSLTGKLYPLVVFTLNECRGVDPWNMKTTLTLVCGGFSREHALLSTSCPVHDFHSFAAVQHRSCYHAVLVIVVTLGLHRTNLSQPHPCKNCVRIRGLVKPTFSRNTSVGIRGACGIHLTYVLQRWMKAFHGLGLTTQQA